MCGAHTAGLLLLPTVVAINTPSLVDEPIASALPPMYLDGSYSNYTQATYTHMQPMAVSATESC